MAKRIGQGSETTKEFRSAVDFDPSKLNFEQVGSKDIQFFPFEEGIPTYFTNLRQENDVLEYGGYIATHCQSGRDYYLKAHKKVAEAANNNPSDAIFKITWNGSTTFSGGRKTYNSYDIEVAK